MGCDVVVVRWDEVHGFHTPTDGLVWVVDSQAARVDGGLWIVIHGSLPAYLPSSPASQQNAPFPRSRAAAAMPAG